MFKELETKFSNVRGSESMPKSNVTMKCFSLYPAGKFIDCGAMRTMHDNQTGVSRSCLRHVMSLQLCIVKNFKRNVINYSM